MRVWEWLERNIWMISLILLFIVSMAITYNACQIMYYDIIEQKIIRDKNNSLDR